MQRVALLLLTAVVAFASANHFSRVKSEVSNLATSVVIRQKREESTGSPRACNRKCEQSLEDSIKNHTVYEGAESPFSILKEGFDAAGIEAVCKEFEKSKSCFTVCNEPSNALGVYMIICEQKKQDLITHLPCYHKAKSDTEKACEDKCGGTAVVGAIATANTGDTSSPGSIAKLLNSMRPMCTFLNCAIECAAGVFDKKCTDDPKAGAFFREIGMAGAKTALGELEALDAALGTKLLPKECLAIIAPNEAALKNSETDFRAAGVETQNFSSGSSNTCDELQKEVYEKQLALLEKQSKLVDIELAKLKLDMKLVEKQLSAKP